MKKIFAFLSVVSILVAFEAGASTTILSCTNGEIDKIGDQHYQIDIFEDGLGFSPYEGQFNIDAADMTYDNGTFSVVNKTVTVTAEGEESSSVINALLVLDESTNTLNAAISVDKGPFQSYEMSCTKVSEN